LYSWTHVLMKRLHTRSYKIKLWDARCGYKNKKSNLATLLVCAQIIIQALLFPVLQQLISMRSSIRGTRTWICVSRYNHYQMYYIHTYCIIIRVSIILVNYIQCILNTTMRANIILSSLRLDDFFNYLIMQ